MKTTRQLDEIYYSILEKVTGLHSTIDKLQELSTLTDQLHTELKSETAEFGKGMQGRIDDFDGLSTQRDKINVLEDRVRTSRTKAYVLSQRLESARRRVQTLEKRESEWQAGVNSKSCLILFTIMISD